MSKQLRPKSDPAESGIRPGSTLFATNPALLNISVGSKMELINVKDKYDMELRLQPLG